MRLGPAPQPGESPLPPALESLCSLWTSTLPRVLSLVVFCSAVAHVPLKASGKGIAGIGHLSLFFSHVLLWEISSMQ